MFLTVSKFSSITIALFSDMNHLRFKFFHVLLQVKYCLQVPLRSSERKRGHALSFVCEVKLTMSCSILSFVKPSANFCSTLLMKTSCSSHIKSNSLLSAIKHSFLLSNCFILSCKTCMEIILELADKVVQSIHYLFLLSNCFILSYKTCDDSPLARLFSTLF